MYLQQHGADVEATDNANRASYRSRLGVPDAAASCHTATVNGYVIEGHVGFGRLRGGAGRLPYGTLSRSVVLNADRGHAYRASARGQRPLEIRHLCARLPER